jgi:hypothetical protein
VAQMNKFISSLLVGLILLYFVDIALRVHNLNLEMLTHNLVRFFAGFVILGIWVWDEHKIGLKVSLYIILAFLISDDIFDYIRGVDNISVPMFLHDLYIVFWGAISGLFFVKCLEWKK